MDLQIFYFEIFLKNISHTDKKEDKISSCIRKLRGIWCKVIYDYNGLLIFMETYVFAPDPI
jgi:hypothetical protein